MDSRLFVKIVHRGLLALGLILGQIDPNCFPEDNYSAEDSSSGGHAIGNGEGNEENNERAKYEVRMCEDTQGPIIDLSARIATKFGHYFLALGKIAFTRKTIV